MPTLGLGGGYTPAFEGNINMLSVVYGLKLLAKNVWGIQFQIQDIGLQKRAQTCNKSS